jgi:ABC-type cobalamin/Fe3+-siderophores transport system ATPase subunit
MRFSVIPAKTSPPSEARDACFLITDNWDDWAKFRTQYALVVFDSSGSKIEPGDVKIGEQGLLPATFRELAPGKRAPSIPSEFEQLPNTFFSLGQSDTYYEALSSLPQHVTRTILLALRDCAFDLSIFDTMRNEEVMRDSLLRSVPESAVRNRYHQLANGDAALSQFYFTYRFAGNNVSIPIPEIHIHVMPFSEPPTNVHVLIGRNGVGKTRCMQGIARALLKEQPVPAEDGSIIITRMVQPEWSFAGVVAVSFSAFDRFTLPAETKPGIKAAMIGPVQNMGEVQIEPGFDVGPYTEVFCASLGRCRNEPRRSRLLAAIETLENDPLFAEFAIAQLLDLPDEGWYHPARQLFDTLSSGHAVVLLTITRLVELVEEQTIVLVDEPESHLHPPLLSALIRALSDLLFKRNGVALIATHSPVVLQEVPKSCVWMLRRAGQIANAERPSVETFGENVGVLTREVFGLEVTNSGFHQLIKRAVENPANTFDNVVEKFDGQLGAEAQAIVRNLIALRDRNRSQE